MLTQIWSLCSLVIRATWTTGALSALRRVRDLQKRTTLFSWRHRPRVPTMSRRYVHFILLLLSYVHIIFIFFLSLFSKPLSPPSPPPFFRQSSLTIFFSFLFFLCKNNHPSNHSRRTGIRKYSIQHLREYSEWCV